MIRHIIMFKLKDLGTENIKNQKLKELKKMIDELGIKIPEIVSIEAGINFSTRDVAYDLVLNSVFKTREDLQKYVIHPDHQEVVKFLKDIKSVSAVVDFEF